MAAPNFFIVGAPKCGTTAMFDYLAAHPEVFMPARKEPTYFAHDLDLGTRADGRYFVREQDRYLDLFAGWSGQRRIGEGSVWYLYSEVAAAEIKKFEPGARIIVMLRNPVEMAYSLHAQRLASGAEDIDSFEDSSLPKQNEPKAGASPRNAFVAKGLLYRQVVRYTGQVRRYIAAFGRDQILVLFFDDFTTDPAATYRRVCEFLDIDASFQPPFERVNTNTVVRSRLLRDALSLMPGMPGWKSPGPLRKRWRKVRRKILRANERSAARPPLERQVRASLEEDLLRDVEELGRLLDRDLVAYWDFGQDSGRSNSTTI